MQVDPVQAVTWFAEKVGWCWAVNAILLGVIILLGYKWVAWKKKYQKDIIIGYLILMREVFIHMIQNRPVEAPLLDHITRFNNNYHWWETRVCPRRSIVLLL